MTPLRDWFSPGPSPGNWLPKSREAWALTAMIIIVGAAIGRVA